MGYWRVPARVTPVKKLVFWNEHHTQQETWEPGRTRVVPSRPTVRRCPEWFWPADRNDLPRERGIEPRVVYRSDDSGAVLAFVAAGTVALVSELGLDGHEERIVRVGRRRAPGAAPHRAGVAPRASAEPGRRVFMERARSRAGGWAAGSAA
jgi:hypothetical protein